MDRALLISLPPVPAEKRRPEAELWRACERARPRILGALLDAASGALRAVESVRLEGMPRMADFAVWATAAESSLGWEPGSFMEAYAGNRAEATESALETDPVALAVREFMEDRDEWTGTAGELWEKLNERVGEAIRHTKVWPGAPNALSARLKRLAPALRGTGIEYEDARLPGGERKRAKRLVERTTAQKTVPIVPTVPQAKKALQTRVLEAGRSPSGWDDPKTIPPQRPSRKKSPQNRAFGTPGTVGTMICASILGASPEMLAVSWPGLRYGSSARSAMPVGRVSPKTSSKHLPALWPPSCGKTPRGARSSYPPWKGS